MADRQFSQELLDFIESDDRLAALALVADVDIQPDPASAQWVISVRPHPSGSPPFMAFTDYGVHRQDLDGAIRVAWGKVAQAALDYDHYEVQAQCRRFDGAIPQDLGQEPELTTWIPRLDGSGWESATQYHYWCIDGMTMVRQEAVYLLDRIHNGYRVTAPNGRMVDYRFGRKPLDEDAPVPFLPVRTLAPDGAVHGARLSTPEASKPNQPDQPLSHDELMAFVDLSRYRIVPFYISAFIATLGVITVILTFDSISSVVIAVLVGLWFLKRILIYTVNRQRQKDLKARTLRATASRVPLPPSHQTGQGHGHLTSHPDPSPNLTANPGSPEEG